MKNDCTVFAMSAVIFFALGAIFGLFIGNCNTRAFQREAVKVGVAEYHVNETGNVTFHWRENGLQNPPNKLP